MIENAGTRSSATFQKDYLSQTSPVFSQKSKKELSIETLRGLAILLVVAGYIINDDLARGSDHSIFSSAMRFVYYLFTPIRMPLFTVISAYLYASSPATRETFKKLMTGKARRIMIPFAVVSAIQYLVFSFIPVNGPQPLQGVYKVYILPYEQLWFLCAIFWIFLIVGVMDSLRLLASPRKWLLCLGLSLALHMAIQPTRLFSLNGVNYLFPFFLMGYGIKRYSNELFSRKMVAAYLVTAFIACSIYVGLYFEAALSNVIPYHLHKLVGLSVTLSAVPLIFHFRRSIPFLAKVGSYAFGIHLFNKIGLAPIEVLFANLGIRNDVVIFTAYLVGSVGLAIGIQILLEQYSVTRKFVLGIKDPPGTKPLQPMPTIWQPGWQLVRVRRVTIAVLAAISFSFAISYASDRGGALMAKSSELICKTTGMCDSMKAGQRCAMRCAHCRGTHHQMPMTKV